jgi:hypothetical protein
MDANNRSVVRNCFACGEKARQAVNQAQRVDHQRGREFHEFTYHARRISLGRIPQAHGNFSKRHGPRYRRGPRAINEIVLGKRAITPAMSIRFGAFFGQSPECWHGIRVECDFRALAKERKRLTAKIRPVAELARVA